MQIENTSSKKIKENKYKILRMSLLLEQESNNEETINNFEDAAREIDSMNNETYLEELESKFYETKTLEEEAKKLTDLTDYIEGRISQRDSLISDFSNITGRTLLGLGEIKYENKLFEYQERLNNINDYLSNNNKIEEYTEELNKLKDALSKEEHEKELNENKNEELEAMLLRKFKEVVASKVDIDEVTEDNIDDKILDLNEQIRENEKTLDIFTKSYDSLKKAGLSYEDEIEYKSYVIGARDNYYEIKEKDYILNIYKLLLTNEKEFKDIYIKRENINSLLNSRIELRNNLEITETDGLSGIYNIITTQNRMLKDQKDNIDNISNITSQINCIEQEIETLKEDNTKVEILSILREFNMLDTYEEFKDEIELPSNDIEEQPSEIDIPSDLDIPNFEDNLEENNEKIEEINLPSDNLEETKEQVTEEIELPSDTYSVEEEKKDEVVETISPKEEETKEEETDIEINKPYKNNFVMGIHDPIKLNADECVEKATNVMRRVGKMLKIEIPEETKEEEVKVELPKEEIKEEIKTEQPDIEQMPKEEIKPQEEVSSPFIQPFVQPEPIPNVEEIKESSSQPTSSPFISPFVIPEKEETPKEEIKEEIKVESPKEEVKEEQSNVKNILPKETDFWSMKQDDNDDNEDFPDISTSNDDFFANNMDSFEFPDLDEFK